ncbi:MAG: hypothetical protein EOP24_39685 [Hyphomicrobiales bacterium]|nr:MAG: hypothetical protein EOP24_39685 [Hyphomicrobiales bacterium]
MSALDTLRDRIPAAAREQLYTYATAAVLLVAGLGYISQEEAPLWVAVVGASVVLLFALTHSTSPWRTSLYALLAVLAPLALWYSIGTETGWAAVLTFAATVFGITKAAGKTPVVIDGQVENVTTYEHGVDPEVARDVGGHDIAEPGGRHRSDE